MKNPSLLDTHLNGKQKTKQKIVLFADIEDPYGQNIHLPSYYPIPPIPSIPPTLYNETKKERKKREIPAQYRA